MLGLGLRRLDLHPPGGGRRAIAVDASNGGRRSKRSSACADADERDESDERPGHTVWIGKVVRSELPRTRCLDRGMPRSVLAQTPCKRAAADNPLRVVSHTLAQAAVRGHDPDGRFELCGETGDLVVAGLRAFPDHLHVMSLVLAPGCAPLHELLAG